MDARCGLASAKFAGRILGQASAVLHLKGRPTRTARQIMRRIIGSECSCHCFTGGRAWHA